MGLLDGRVAFITGAARGQGRSHAVRLASEGADVIAVDVCIDDPALDYPLGTAEDLAETVRLVEAQDRRIVASQADVRDPDALTQAVESGVAELGRLDIVLANAGVTAYGSGEPSWEISAERWRTVMDTDATGVFNTLKASVPSILAGERGGAIVLTSSVVGLKGMPKIADYVAAKHAVVGIMRAFALELAPHEVRINSVHPTAVATKLIENEAVAKLIEIDPSILDGFSNLLDVDALQPSDISDTVLFLVSDQARYITGHTMPVDAGYMAR